MAKKPTLKDLFGVGGDRTQVSLDLGQTALNPAVPRGGNYNVVVQSTPKTNKALEFAANLEKGVNLYGNVVDFNVKRAETDIAKLNDTQVAELIAGNDKDALSIFGYNKAYNYGLVKRYYATKKAEIVSQIDEMTNNTEDTDILDFKRRLDARKVEMYDVIGEQFKGNRYTSEAHDALFSATVTPLIEQAELKFQENQKVAVRAEYLTDSAQILDTRDKVTGKYVSDMTTALQVTKDNLAARNLEDNKEKKSIYEDVVRNGIADALLNDDPDRARELLKQAGEFQIFKGAKLDSTLLKTLEREIDTAESKSDESISKFLGLIDNQGEGLAALLMTGSDESVLASLRATLKTIGYDDAYIDASLQGFELTGTPNQKGAQVMRKIAELQVDEKNQRKINGLGALIETLGDPRRIATEPSDLVTLDDLRRAAPIIERAILANPTASRAEHLAALKLLLLDESGNPLPIESFAKEINSALARTNWSNPEASSFSRVLNGYTKGAQSILVEEEYTPSQIASFEAALTEKAQSLWDRAARYDENGVFIGHDRASFDEKLETFSEQLYDDLIVRDNAEQLHRRLNKEGLDAANVSESLSEAGDLADSKYDFESLNPDNPKREDAMKDREGIIALSVKKGKQIRKKTLLIGSLIQYGFPTIESFDPKLLKETGLTYSDIYLGSEVISRLNDAIDGFNSDDPTRQQEDAMEYWKEYGVFDRSDAEQLLDAQDDFRQKISAISN